jgi:hypothetical protein
MFHRRTFQSRNIATLWDDSDDDDNDNDNGNIQDNKQPKADVIDLTSSPPPIKHLANVNRKKVTSNTTNERSLVQSASSSSIKQIYTIQEYVPRTLRHQNRRHSILPAFPTPYYVNKPPLLLANVPSMSLKISIL